MFWSMTQSILSFLLQVKSLCINAATNGYRYKLITCLVKDKFKQGTCRYNNNINKLITTHGTVDSHKNQNLINPRAVASFNNYIRVTLNRA